MAIITKPQTIQKGVPASFSLSKLELATNSVVLADSYFCDVGNWNKVIITYKSSEGNQYEIVEFDATIQFPTGQFLASDKAKNSFEVHTIEIVDFDGGILEIKRSELTVADFDVTLQ